ncbi:hypothetical protein AKJ09_02740 [Labilithrix luteola]|uniref:Uncharacterized protein n=1 Tax=Labilithrix luteola TaxID=1391654 RepID=A0A0K1PRQ7_9BACT|nr:hypothetical protein AKJ09_02740 [Labilithrix luteola]
MGGLVDRPERDENPENPGFREDCVKKCERTRHAPERAGRS